MVITGARKKPRQKIQQTQNENFLGNPLFQDRTIRDSNTNKVEKNAICEFLW